MEGKRIITIGLVWCVPYVCLMFKFKNFLEINNNRENLKFYYLLDLKLHLFPKNLSGKLFI